MEFVVWMEDTISDDFTCYGPFETVRLAQEFIIKHEKIFKNCVFKVCVLRKPE
jgi:hypothetical protein